MDALHFKMAFLEFQQQNITNFRFRLPKFKSEIKIIGNAIIPNSIVQYFSSMKESSNCSKVCLNQVSLRTPETRMTEESSSSSPQRFNAKQRHKSSSKSLDPPNLVRHESISPTSSNSTSRNCKSYFRIKTAKKKKKKR